MNMVRAVLNYNPRAQQSSNTDGFPPCFMPRKISQNCLCSQATSATPTQFLIGSFKLSWTFSPSSLPPPPPSRKVRKVRKVRKGSEYGLSSFKRACSLFVHRIPLPPLLLISQWWHQLRVDDTARHICADDDSWLKATQTEPPRDGPHPPA